MERVRIEHVEVLPGYRLRLGLSDGRTVERDFAAEVAAPIGPMDAPLQDPAFFAQARLDPELETVVWPNGYDMDPDMLIWGVDANGNLLAPVQTGRMTERFEENDRKLQAALETIEATRAQLRTIEARHEAMRRELEGRHNGTP